MTIRMSWLQPGAFVPLAGLACMFAVLSVARPSASIAYAIGFAVIAAMVGAQIMATRIVLTGSLVVFDQGRLTPKQQASRQRISAIRIFPLYVVLSDSSRNRILTIGGHWAMKQLLKIASVLEVPIYDHRGWSGLRSVKEGRLVTTTDSTAVTQ
jgi:hypothetical protein